ncbi:MAG: hypothetical protein NZ942_00870 [Candidatus Aenigmarchaeota archaeon]|nr:hypothetical protein [Candidatus Aenigmarchaeota archaeon]
MWFELTTLSISSFLIAELFYRSKIKVCLTLQNLNNAKKNLIKIAEKINKKGSSGVIVSIGNKTFHFHHSRLGWILAAISMGITNLYLFSVSLGLILHHLIREKKLF